MLTRKRKGRRTTIADGSPAVWGEEKVSNAAHNVVSQEMCTRSAGVVQHPDALTQLHTGAVHAAVRCPPSPSALF